LSEKISSTKSVLKDARGNSKKNFFSWVHVGSYELYSEIDMKMEREWIKSFSLCTTTCLLKRPNEDHLNQWKVPFYLHFSHFYSFLLVCRRVRVDTRLYVSFRMLRSSFNVVIGNSADIWFGVIHDGQENSQGYDIKAPRLATHLLDWLSQGDCESLRCSL